MDILKKQRKAPLREILLNLAAIVVIVAGIKAASSVVILFLLSIFIVVLAAPFFLRMQEKGVPSYIALLILVVGLTALGVFGVHALRLTLDEILRNLPRYQENLQQQVGTILVWLEGKGVETPDQMIRNALAEKTPVRMLTDTITTATQLLGRVFIVLLIAIFILLEAAILPNKLRSIPGLSDDTFDRISMVIDNVRRYIGMKTIMSLLTGALVGGFLFIMGVDYPVLLGILAFILNFIPNLGSIMAGIPGVLLAFIQHGPGVASLVTLGYVVINVFVSNFLEPRYMGRGLGLSPMVIVITLVLWAWVLGPLGMLLSVPLTMALKIAMESIPETRGLAILMGSHPNPGELVQPEKPTP